MHSLQRGVQWHGRRTQQLGVSLTEREVPHGRLRSSQVHRNIQVGAAQAHRPSTDVIEPGPATGSATAVAAASVFSYLGVGSRNSDNVDDGASTSGVEGAAGGSGTAAAAAAAGEALLRQLRLAKEQLGTSLEQLFFDGVAEGLPAWSANQMAGVLMSLALLHRRPDDAWLNEYWPLTAARLNECTTADLAMLSYGVSEMQLRPPQEWTEALLAATLRLAEMPLPPSLPMTAAAEGSDAAVAAQRQPLGATLQLLLQRLTGSGSIANTVTAAVGRQRQPRPRSPWLSPSASTISSASSSAGVSRRYGRSLPAALGKFLPQSNRWVTNSLVVPASSADGRAGVPAQVPLNAQQRLPPASAAISASGLDDGATAAAAACRSSPINSAYDMEDMFGGEGPETSSSIAELVLEPVQALWDGLRRATAAVAAAWRRSRSGSELVTVVYNLTAAGMHVEEAWLARFLEVMRPRLCDLSGDDLHCLLVVAMEAVGGSSSQGLLEAAMSRDWQGDLFARMDAINWAMHGHHLAGCLASISSLGLRPPPPWVRRQLRSFQPGLQFLPTSSLVALGGLLPLMPLYYEGELMTAPLQAAPSTAGENTQAASTSPSSGPWVREDRFWFAGWLAEYRAAVLERRMTMEAADLLAVIAGVAAVVAAVPPSGSSTSSSAASSSQGAAALAAVPSSSHRDVASLLLPRAGEMVSYLEWQRAMVDAVVARLPEASLEGLCEAWQVLADASSGAQLELQQQPQFVRGGVTNADEVAEHLDGLRDLVASRLAVHHAQLSTSDVAPVLSSLAAAGLPLPAATLDALLASAQPLLPGLTSSELVTVALSLVRLSYKPNLAWQAAFCAASRRRLGLMTPPQRCSLLVASASLGLHLPEPWVRDFFAVSERGLGEQLDGTQLANLLWAVSCVASEPAASWLEQWEYASMPRLRELGPNMLAVVLKAMSTLHYRPSLAWQSAFFTALQRRLFAAGAAQLTPWEVKEDADDDVDAAAAAAAAAQHEFQPFPAEGERPSPSSSISPSSTSFASRSPPSSALPASTTICSSSNSSSSRGSSSSSSGSSGMLSYTVTVEALNSLVYSLASLDLSPPPAWLDELADAIRCKLSLLSTLDLSVVLAYLVARSHRPNDEWWESFLEALESRFDSLSASEMSSLLVMINALRVSPAAQWLDAFCTATQSRLSFFQPSHLLQVLSCLHLFRHRPGQAWMAAYTAAVEGQLPRFTPTELARAMMLLDNLNQRPSVAFMLRFYDYSRPGLAQLDTQELVNVAWAVVSCSTLQPDIRWTEALVEAARPRVAALQQPQLRVLVAALGHMQRGAPCVAAEDFLAFAREFLMV